MKALVPTILENGNNLSRPRVLKSHNVYSALPLEVRNKKVKVFNYKQISEKSRWKYQSCIKIIVVHRNPRDVCLSWYNHTRIYNAYKGDLDLLINSFTQNAGMIQGPSIKHVLSFWNQRHEHPILFISFEDMKRNLEKVVRDVSNFLGKTVPESKMDLLLDHLSFNKMKNNPMVNKSNKIEVSAKILFLA